MKRIIILRDGLPPQIAHSSHEEPPNQSPTLAVKSTPPMQRDKWPPWAKALALLARNSDKGLGDVIERIVGPIGGDAYKTWHLKTYGQECGCEARKEHSNATFPLP